MHLSIVINKKTREVKLYDSSDTGWVEVERRSRVHGRIPLITKCAACDTLYYVNGMTSLYTLAHKYFIQNNSVWELYPHNCPSCREHITEMMKNETGEGRTDLMNLLNKGRDYALSLSPI